MSNTTTTQSIDAPAELNERDLNQVTGGLLPAVGPADALPPIRGPKQPADSDLIGLL